MLKKIMPKTEFTKNVVTLMTGTTIAQAIPIAITPILTRIYTPDDFGILALFAAVTAIIASVAGGRYETAIMLPKKDDDAINIAALSVLLVTIVSFLMLFVVIVFNNELSHLLGNEDIGFWLYFSPLVIFLMGLFNNLNYLNIRKKLFKDIAKANVYKSIGTASVQLSFGFIRSGAAGLISGQIFAQFISTYRLALNVVKNYKINVSFYKLFSLAKRYRDFPLYSAPSAFVNTGSLQAPVLLLTSFFSQSVTGFFSVSIRIISLPVSLLGNSIGQVFFQQVSNNLNNNIEISYEVQSTLKKLVLVALLPFSFLVVFGDLVFSFVLGEAWYQSGVYAQYLSIWMFFLFIHSPLTPLFDILEKQKQALFFTTALLLARIVMMFAAYYLYEDPVYVVISYSLTGVVFNLAILFYLLVISNLKPWFDIAKIISSFVFVIFIFYIIRVVLKL